MNYITLFNKNYLPKGIALYKSIIPYSFTSFNVLCLDKYTYDYLKSSFPSIKLFTEDDLREFFNIDTIKESRSTVEYFWTLSSVFTNYFLKTYKADVTYLDADIFFYNDPNFVFFENDCDIILTDHNFSSDFTYLIPYGKYNVQFVTFKYTDNSIKVSDFWMQSCVDWCFNYLDIKNERFGDQKYLEKFSDISSSLVYVVPYPGFGVAPWNFKNYLFTVNNSVPYVDNNPLYFYHFHQFHIFQDFMFCELPKKYQKNYKKPSFVYDKYKSVLIEVLSDLDSYDPNFSKIYQKKYIWFINYYIKNMVPFSIKKNIYSFLSFIKNLIGS